jgi:hypothetical protein
VCNCRPTRAVESEAAEEESLMAEEGTIEVAMEDEALEVRAAAADELDRAASAASASIARRLRSYREVSTPVIFQNSLSSASIL